MNRLSKIYTILAVIFPILQLYGIGISTVSIADLLLLLLYPFLIVKNNWRCVNQGFLFYALFVFSIGLFFHPIDGIFKMLRYFCYVLALALFSNTFFDFKYGSRIFSILALFATVFMLFQYLCFHYLGFYVPGYLPGLPIMRSELIEYTSLIGTDGGDVRVRSIFGEPAHYAQYIVGYIALMVGAKNKNTLLLFFLFLGILVSGSSTGIIAGAFLFVILFSQTGKIRLKAYVWYMLFLAMGLGLYLMTHSSFYNSAIDKLQSERSIAARLSGFEILLSEFNYTNVELLFGHGIGSTNIYLPGYLMLFYYLGLISLLIYIFVNVKIYFSINRKRKILLLLFAILNIGTEVVMGPFIILYFSFILSKNIEYDT